MIPVMQTKFATCADDGTITQRGNCLAACVASILEKSIEEIPELVALDPKFDQLYALRGYLESLDMSLILLMRTMDYHPISNGWYIVSGPTVRGSSHACVYRYGMLKHDPYPGGKGVLELESFTIICAGC